MNKKRKLTSSTNDTTLEKRSEESYAVMDNSPRKNGKDICDIYGELIACKLRRMDERTRNFVMNGIDNFIYQTILRPSHSPPSHINSNIQSAIYGSLNQNQQYVPFPSQINPQPSNAFRLHPHQHLSDLKMSPEQVSRLSSPTLLSPQSCSEDI